MKLIIASNNAHKIREIKEILSGHFDEIVSMRDAGIDIDVVEDGETFTDNAKLKSRAIIDICDGDAVLSDDSGLIVDALNGEPGVYSARYAGEGHDDEANNEKLLENLKGVPTEKRTARYACAISLIFKDGKEYESMGYAEGHILTARCGENGFGYDPLFYFDALGKSFAELLAEEKNNVSHRKAAIEDICKQLNASKK